LRVNHGNHHLNSIFSCLWRPLPTYVWWRWCVV